MPTPDATVRSPARLLGPGEVLAGVATLALWVGGVHAAIVAARRLVFHDFAWQSRDVTWMAPAGYALVLAAVMLPAWLVHRAMPAQVPARVPLFLAAWVAAVAVVLWVSALHPAAVLALGAGAGWQVATLLAARGRGRRVMRWGAGAIAACVVVASAVAWQSVRGAAAAPAAAAPTAAEPDVLLVILDTVRAASLSLYGYGRGQPSLDSLAADGVAFDRAIAPSSWTLPSHASIFTGRPSHELSADWRTPLATGIPTVAEAFAAAGYRTGGFSANHFYASFETGLGRGFAHWQDYERSLRQVLLSTTVAQVPMAGALLRSRTVAAVLDALRRLDLRIHVSFNSAPTPAGSVVDRFLAWRAAAGAPYFAFLNLYDAHEPYEVPAEFADRYGGGTRDRYDGAITYVDAQLARLVQALRSSGALDRTVLVITSDHGQQLGEHGLQGHGNSLYDEVLRVPLVVRYPPRVPPGGRVAGVASLTALPATLLDLAGVANREFRTWPSLAGHWAGDPPRDAPAAHASVRWSRHLTDPSPLRRGDMHAIVDDSLLVIRDGRGEFEAFLRRGARADSVDPRSPPALRLRGAFPSPGALPPGPERE